MIYLMEGRNYLQQIILITNVFHEIVHLEKY